MADKKTGKRVNTQILVTLKNYEKEISNVFGKSMCLFSKIKSALKGGTSESSGKSVLPHEKKK